MIRRPPRSTRTDTLFPYTTLFRSFGSSGDSLSWLLHRQRRIKSRRGRNPDLRGFKRSAVGYAKVSCVLAAGGRDKRPLDGARPNRDSLSRRGKIGTRPTRHGVTPSRSDESRVGKECFSTCRSRWTRGHLKKK